ncbi:MAG: hypothetical protein JKY37_24085 [Nannocystaceae bacterium]|nr:hypothetical protein [Nannocystaceae bacterium]
MILSALVLGVISGGPSVPSPASTVEITVNAPATTSGPRFGDPQATLARRAKPRPAQNLVDPFLSAGIRVAVAAPTPGLQDPFAAPNLAARYRNTTRPDAGLHDPFES